MSVDLAYKHYCDVGIAVLEPDGKRRAACRFLTVDEAGEPETGRLADRLDDWGRRHGAGMLLIDGPQAWKDEHNGLEHCRVAEREAHTPSKTGPPGQVKPRNYAPFTRFSIQLYAFLEQRGWRRPRRADERPSKGLFEVFPYAAWRGLGLKPLPSKRRATVQDIEARTQALENRFLRFSARPNHDQLQAAVAGLAGLAMQRDEGFSLLGVAPFLRQGTWREGFILVTSPPQNRIR